MNWRPGAGPAALRARAELLAATRAFFAARGVLEVETPMLAAATVTEPAIESLVVDVAGGTRYLQTSPEYAMKRLLAAGSGDIYQVARVFRAGEAGSRHNPEFTLLEWYRCDWSMDALVDEVAALLDLWMTQTGRAPRPLIRRRYRDAFREHFGLDPFTTPLPALASLAQAAGLVTAPTTPRADDTTLRDELLDFLVGARLGPALGHGQWLALTHYPASQAALARLDPDDASVALRFEVYADGIELANGFEELGDASEQAARFAADNLARRATGLPERAPDPRLLAALAAGLPPCSGVAVGFDRCVMVATGATHIDEIIAFPSEHA